MKNLRQCRMLIVTVVVSATLWFLVRNRIRCHNCAYVICIFGAVSGWILTAAFCILTGEPMRDLCWMAVTICIVFSLLSFQKQDCKH